MSGCINWNSLPCLLTVNREHENVAAVFTNIDHNLVIMEIPESDLYKDETVEMVREAGGFDCLGQVMKEEEEFVLVLSVTERCNASCRYCFLDAQTSGNVMDQELLHLSIDYVRDHIKNRTINIAAFGGEPSVAPDLVREMVKYGRSHLGKRVRFSITTNGYFNDDFCDFLIENSFHVSLSMDGIPYVQESQRPIHISTKQLEKNISRIAHSSCDLKVRSTVTEFSVPFMLDSVKYLSALGVKRIHFEPVTPGGRAQVHSKFTQQPDVSQFVKGLFDCIDYGKEHDMDIICFPYMNMLSAPMVFCDGNINNRLVVGATGVLSTCVEVQNVKHELFSALGIGLFDAESHCFNFENIARRPFCRGCSNLVKSSKCQSCPFHFFCAGGCPTRNYRGTENTEEISDYRCHIVKAVMPRILEKYYQSTYSD